MTKVLYVNGANWDLCLNSMVDSVAHFYREYYHGHERGAMSDLHIELVCRDYDPSLFTPDRIGEERVNLLCRAQERMDNDGSAMCYGFGFGGK